MSNPNTERTPDWKLWARVPRVKLWEGIALSLNINPPLIADIRPFDKREELERRLFIAERNLGKYPCLEVEWTPVTPRQLLETEMSLPGFVTFACAVEWEIPEELARIGKQWEGKIKVDVKWPWGNRETVLLRRLAEAAHQFWSTYDPEQPSTAPTSEEVSTWLVDQGVSQRVAEVMAQILRADGLPTGPRK